METATKDRSMLYAADSTIPKNSTPKQLTLAKVTFVMAIY